MRRSLLAMLFAFAASLAGAAPSVIVPEPGYTVSGTLDWVAGTLTVEIAHELDPSIASLTRAKGDAETDVDARLGDFFLRALAPLPVDSSRRMDDLLGSDPSFAARLREQALSAPRTEVHLSTDFSALVERWVLPFYGPGGLAAPLFPSRATQVRPLLGEVTTRAYTGVVIDARGVLPAAGTTGTASLRPALLPRVWDERMDLVLDASVVALDSLAAHGVVGYARGLDDAAAFERAGTDPLLLAARAVYGTNATDVVISLQGARQLLSLKENIDLLKQGKVVIVCGNL